ncbi:LPXTG cell wall anchor domain-containing protein, partial [Leucobacter zeae]|nr:LPXTG cell wall anchor domain-containing protein [Leucobacter zeae]
PEATVVVRDADGTDVTDAVVDAEGNWSVDGLECGTTYTIVQVLAGAESASTEFTTAACDTDANGGNDAAGTAEGGTDADGGNDAQGTAQADAQGGADAAGTANGGSDTGAKATSDTGANTQADADGKSGAKGNLAQTGSDAFDGIALGAMALLGLGVGAVLIARRRHRA